MDLSNIKNGCGRRSRWNRPSHEVDGAGAAPVTTKVKTQMMWMNLMIPRAAVSAEGRAVLAARRGERAAHQVWADPDPLAR